MIGNAFECGLLEGSQWHLLSAIDEPIVFVLIRAGILELMLLIDRLLREGGGQLSNNHHVDVLILREARLQ